MGEREKYDGGEFPAPKKPLQTKKEGTRARWPGQASLRDATRDAASARRGSATGGNVVDRRVCSTSWSDCRPSEAEK